MARYRVRLKSVVMWWETVEIDDSRRTDETPEEMREWAADDAVDLADPEQRAQAVASGEAEWGPIELDESVKEDALVEACPFRTPTPCASDEHHYGVPCAGRPYCRISEHHEGGVL